jgi:hypothetical protein
MPAGRCGPGRDAAAGLGCTGAGSRLWGLEQAHVLGLLPTRRAPRSLLFPPSGGRLKSEETEAYTEHKYTPDR